MNLSGTDESCWVDTAPSTHYPAFARSGDTEIAVVGAGIVGLTVAHALCRKGARVTVLEALRVGRQVTGRSTAKITSQHSLIYAHLVRHLDRNSARVYAEANEAGLRHIRQCIADGDIACDLEAKDAFAYTRRPNRIAALELEAKIVRAFGIDADVVTPAPLPFATAAALRFRVQAQFNPVRYLIGLADVFVRAGGTLFENSRVDRVERDGARWVVASGRHRLSAASVVLATHLPIAGPLKLDRATRPRSHPALAFRIANRDAIDGMFIDVDSPTHSLRMGRDAGGPLLVALGPKFPTGHERDVALRFRDLEHWVRGHLPVGPVIWRWVNEDYDSPDRIPLAGAVGSHAPRMYVATGFNGWGITNGAAAGLLIADSILDRPNAAAELFDPTRLGRATFNPGGDTRSLKRTVDGIAPGEGGVIVHGREKLAVWKSPQGQVHALSAACTHQGCTVTWNNAAQTWDCPCHGSVFTRAGEVLHGPATMALPARRLATDRRDAK